MTAQENKAQTSWILKEADFKIDQKTKMIQCNTNFQIFSLLWL